MSEEKWATHVNCEASKRDHKWRWKVDIASGMPSPDEAICVHCGKETVLTRLDYLEGQRGVTP